MRKVSKGRNKERMLLYTALKFGFLTFEINNQDNKGNLFFISSLHTLEKTVLKVNMPNSSKLVEDLFSNNRKNWLKLLIQESPHLFPS